MKIFTKKKSKGKISAKIFLTACQDYSPDMKEFVFAIRGRPFAMLSSQKLPVPPVSLIDYDLVRDLGLEMKDLQCTKHTFGGQKMRILGRISQTLQTIQDGAVSGTAHVRANVVENLHKTFDTHSIAGQQVLSSLQPPSDHPSDVETSPRHRSQPEWERQVPRSHSQPPSSTASGRSEPRTSSSSPAPDISGTRSPSVSQSSPPSAAAVPIDDPNHPDFDKHNFLYSTWYSMVNQGESPPRHRAQPERERQVRQVQLARSPTPDEVKGPLLWGRIMKISSAEVGCKAEVDFVGKNTGKIYTRVLHDINRHFPLYNCFVNKVQATSPLMLGEAVACRWRGDEVNQKDPLEIISLVNNSEESRLSSGWKSIIFPPLPPDLHPGGYYG